MTAICIVAFDGFTDLDVFLHWDLLNRPKLIFGPEVSPWEVLLVGTEESHTSAAGMTVPMQGSVDEARFADAVLVASGKATRQLMYDFEYLARLALDPEKQLVASQCSGALILGGLGLLQGLKATTHPSARDELAGVGAQVVEESLAIEGRIATAAGCLAGAELSRWLIAQLVDQATADQCLASAGPVGAGATAMGLASGV